mmetsp:Transcript_85904/g.168043  ORF Transcript_85904/g.168043 Transcript_85904/m.168043 type:complete len:963 (-) Transcript_85904:51-2939(-)
MNGHDDGYDRFVHQPFHGSSSVGDSVDRDSQLFIEKNRNLFESMDFEETESVMWRKHQLRRFFQDRQTWWTNSRRTTARKWVLITTLGLTIGAMGYFVSFLTSSLTDFKYNSALDLIDKGNWEGAFFAFMGICLFYASVAGMLCWMEPSAGGSGIPEIKAYLNGINLNKVVRIRVLIFKVIGMCFSVGAGLPLGKEGPMIHAGSVAGAAISQGKSMTFGFDTSWTKFQDLRNDRSKRDFVTFGGAAGVAAAFSAPIGGVLFTLEEGASFWSTSITFRAFFCAMITQLTLNLLYSGFQLGRNRADGLFAFGLFDDFSGYATFELFIFILMGACGGAMGAFYNEMNRRAALFRAKIIGPVIWKRALELFCVTLLMGVITFIMPLVWASCTPIPTDTADWSDQEVNLLDKLVQFQCSDNQYNQVASLYFVPADVALQQLFHFRESGGTTYTTFDTGALLLFFIPYFSIAMLVSGMMVPAGLFVPMLVSGASYGRIVGHILNTAFPGHVTDAGTYALIGAAALLGGMSRMTMAGTIIMLEASGNSEYLLPLMLTFAAARYFGNAINHPIYDMFIHLKDLPFLESSLKTLGLLNYHPVVEIMAHPVVTLGEISKVGDVHRILSTMSHNGFPVIGKTGHLRGMILRKHLCTLMKLKAFSSPVVGGQPGQLAPAATVFHDTLERTYPNYPRIEDIILTPTEMNCYLDIRPYMDTSPYTINASSSVQRCYRFFRTMGLRHLIVLDGDHRVTGMITRKDISESRLEDHWYREGENMQKFLNYDADGAHEGAGLLSPSTINTEEDFASSGMSLNLHTFPSSGFGGGGDGGGLGSETSSQSGATITSHVPSFGGSPSSSGYAPPLSQQQQALTAATQQGADPYNNNNNNNMASLYDHTGADDASSTSNPLATSGNPAGGATTGSGSRTTPRYPVPTISAAGAGAGAGPSGPPSQSVSKIKKAMKEPKSMRSST